MVNSRDLAGEHRRRRTSTPGSVASRIPKFRSLVWVGLEEAPETWKRSRRPWRSPGDLLEEAPETCWKKPAGRGPGDLLEEAPETWKRPRRPAGRGPRDLLEEAPETWKKPRRPGRSPETWKKPRRPAGRSPGDLLEEAPETCWEKPRRPAGRSPGDLLEETPETWKKPRRRKRDSVLGGPTWSRMPYPLDHPGGQRELLTTRAARENC